MRAEYSGRHIKKRKDLTASDDSFFRSLVRVLVKKRRPWHPRSGQIESGSLHGTARAVYSHYCWLLQDWSFHCWGIVYHDCRNRIPHPYGPTIIVSTLSRTGSWWSSPRIRHSPHRAAFWNSRLV